MNPKSWYADIEPDAPAQINTDQPENVSEERAERRKGIVMTLLIGCAAFWLLLLIADASLLLIVAAAGALILAAMLGRFWNGKIWGMGG